MLAVVSLVWIAPVIVVGGDNGVLKAIVAEMRWKTFSSAIFDGVRSGNRQAAHGLALTIASTINKRPTRLNSLHAESAEAVACAFLLMTRS